ncbi:hypothetical protein C8R47DRAFT_450226 [Mycena vitilis]|nr:hypothetical protein C8R47DRAFT_450226 [Mycena vitilis]
MSEITYNASRPLPKRTHLYDYPLPNAPKKSLIAFRVTFPPNGAFPPHSHNGASVAGHVISGCILNGMNDEPAAIVQTGASWFEAPGCRHRVFENGSATEEAEALAVYVIDTSVIEEGGYGALVLVEEDFQ